MSFSANTAPRDVNGNPIEPGFYRVSYKGQVRIGQVVEAEETSDLIMQFRGEDRPQRVDELSQFCTWAACEQSEINDLTA